MLRFRSMICRIPNLNFMHSHYDLADLTFWPLCTTLWPCCTCRAAGGRDAQWLRHERDAQGEDAVQVLHRHRLVNTHTHTHTVQALHRHRWVNTHTHTHTVQVLRRHRWVRHYALTHNSTHTYTRTHTRTHIHLLRQMRQMLHIFF